MAKTAFSGIKTLSQWLLLSIVFSQTPLSATHIVGGEINYRYLGNDDYEVTLIVYRDCFNGVPPFDDPASVGIFLNNSAFTFVQELLMPPLDSLLIPPTITSPCLLPPTNICYRKAIYQGTVNLPPSSDGYWLAYQRCCRNQTILNIVNPGQRGSTFTAFIPPVFTDNGNPAYDSLPPTFICQSAPFAFKHSATDPDGDSLVYTLCTPLDFDGFASQPMPQPPDPPPYDSVPWNPPYDLTNVLGGTPLTIDPVSGWITCTPSTQGQFVFGVCTREYRNGVYLSTTRRDFQVNVVSCPTLVVAALQYPQVSCLGNSITFINQSFNAGTYDWDFGDPTTLADTSHDFSPTYIYPDTGTYSVMLVAHSTINSLCNDTIFVTLQVYRSYEVEFTHTGKVCDYEITLNDSVLNNNATVTWNWDFGDGTTSTLSDPIHVYSQAGTYTVNLVGTNSAGCVDTFSAQVDFFPLTQAIASAQDERCYGECNATAMATASYGYPPYSYQWNDPMSQVTPFADSLCVGTYMVIVTDSAGCKDTSIVNTQGPPPLQLTLQSQTDYCRNGCFGNATAIVSGGNGGYIYNWNDPSNQTQSFASQLCQGWYTVGITDNKGCQLSDSVFVSYADTLPDVAASADEDTLYVGQQTYLHATSASGYIYTWSPSGTLNFASSSDPLSTPSATTTYVIEVTDSNGCRVTDTVTIVVLDVLCREPEIFVPSAFTPNFDNENDVLFVRGSTIEEMYFTIYDRWGEKIFETEDQKTGWDGIFKGEKVTPGVFVYYLKAKCFDNSEYEHKGNITVIR